MTLNPHHSELTLSTPHGDCRVSVWRTEKGVTPFFFLHGWGRDHSSMLPLASLLEDLGEMIFVDLPGFGFSPAPPSPWSSKEYAQLIADLIEKLNLRNVILVTHSFGGRIALRLAAQHPKNIKKVVLIASAGLKRKRSWSWHLRALWVKYLLQMAQVFVGPDSFWARKITARYGSTDYQNAGVMRPTLVRMVNEELSSILKSVAPPTLLLWGDEDQETPPDMGKYIAQKIPHAEFHLFSGFGHNSILSAGKHLIESAIRNFVKE